MSDYVDMISNLGPDHARVFAARIDGKVVAWSIVTINGDHAVYYYACMRTEIMRQHVPDKLIYVICCTLGEQGCTVLDLMGIGNDFAPSLKSLNGFKTKFSESIAQISAGRHSGQEGILPFAHAAAVAASQTAQVIIAPHDG